MQICLESYLLINLMMNALIMDLATRALGRRRPARVWLAAALGAVWATLIYIPGLSWLGALPFRLVIPALMAYAACGKGGARDWAACMAASMCMTMLLGGGALMISLMSGGWGWSQLGLCLTACSLAGLWLTHTRLKRCWGWELDVRIANGGERCRLTALVDTGNHLREPVSGACVLIASERALRSVLPRDFDARSDSLPSRRWRMVGYSTLNAQGRMKCFRPDSVTVRVGKLSLTRSDIWIAVHPGSLPGGAEALAPLEMSCLDGGAREGGGCGDACSYRV